MCLNQHREFQYHISIFFSLVKHEILLIEVAYDYNAYYPLAHGNGARVYISEHNGQMNSFEEKNAVSLAEKYNKTPGQIILNWEVAQGIITIPGSSQFDRAKENLGALDFQMSDEEIKMMNVYGKKMKFCGCRRFFGMNIMA